MKNLFFTLGLLIVTFRLMAQVPEAMSYVAVIRGSENILVKNEEVGMQISILKNSPEGDVVYSETHSVTTNNNGVVSLEIGSGSSKDDFSAITWGEGPFFVMTETDPNGGNNYSVTVVNQMLSVPYAFYASEAEKLSQKPVEQIKNYDVLKEEYCSTSGYTAKLKIEGVSSMNAGIYRMTVSKNETVLFVENRLMKWKPEETFAEVEFLWESGSPKLNIGDELTLFYEYESKQKSIELTHQFTVATDVCLGSNPPIFLEIRYGDLVIVEVMPNPSFVSDSDGEFFEILNTTSNSLNLKGLVFSDDGSNSFTISEDLILEAGEYFVLGNNRDVTKNGGVNLDYEYSGFSLTNTSDEIIIKNQEGVLIDEVKYTSSFPFVSGKSMALDSNGAHADIADDNDLPENWKKSSCIYGNGDYGTPGSFYGNCP